MCYRGGGQFSWIKISIFVILIFTIIKFVQTSKKVPATISNNQNFRVDDNTEKWDNLSKQMVKMMMNSDVAEQRSFLNVVIFFMGLKNQFAEFSVLYESLSKYGNERIKFLLYSLEEPRISPKLDFAILILHFQNHGIEKVFDKFFKAFFNDRTTKFFIIMYGAYNMNRLNDIWSFLSSNGYKNVYIVLSPNIRDFLFIRTYLKEGSHPMKVIFSLQKVIHDKYLTTRDIADIKHIKVAQHTLYPLSYVKDGQLIGANGNLVHELAKKLGKSIFITNENDIKVSSTKTYMLLKENTDISLYTNALIFSENIDNIFLNEMDGSCMLIPRNIPVSTYENYTFPLDQPSSILIIVSLVLVIVVWKIISIVRGQNRSTISILFLVYELTMNFGASGLDQLSREENILIYSFVLGSFFLVSFYETIFLSFMVTESTMRSAESLTELNNSGTMFHSYFTTRSIDAADLPVIRNDSILNFVDLFDGYERVFLENLDQNMVYLVTCKYAEMYTQSSKNYHESRRMFDKIIIRHSHQNFKVNNGFPFIEEFRNIVNRLIESGIYKFWETENYKNAFGGSKSIQNDHSVQDFIDFQGMPLPLAVLLVGCMLSSIVFGIEHLVYRYLSSNSGCSSSREIEILKKRKLKLNKWMEKYIYQRKVNRKVLSKENKIGSQIKSYESMNNKFVTFKKYKKSIVLHYDKRLTEGKNKLKKEVTQKNLKGGYFVPESWMKVNSKRNKNSENLQAKPLSFRKFTKMSYMSRILNRNKFQPIRHKIIYVRPYRSEENNQNGEQD